MTTTTRYICFAAAALSVLMISDVATQPALAQFSGCASRSPNCKYNASGGHSYSSGQSSNSQTSNSSTGSQPKTKNTQQANH
jgi:hypothetical protein